MKLLIENFYNIKHAELDFKKFNILIGPQAAGKSLIAKAFHLLLETTALQFASSLGKDKQALITQKANSMFETVFGSRPERHGYKIRLNIDANSHIQYTNDGFSKNKTMEKFSTTNAHNLIQEFNIKDDNLRQTLLDKFAEKIIAEITEINDPFSLFVPATRSLVNIVAENLFWMQNNNLDYTLNRFGRLYFHQIKKSTQNTNFDCYKHTHTIKGTLQKETNGYVLIEGDRKTNLENSSSGQQSVLPILLAIEALKGSASQHMFIEEPEAHIFPTAQYNLIRYISGIHTTTDTEITLTTHSPYILTATNTLIYAGTVGKQSEEKAAKVREIIPEDQWLNAEDVAAYMVEADGSVRSIFDEETGLIDADSIDDVSDVIGSEFNKILDIEFEEEAGDA